MTNPISLLSACIAQIPEMGTFEICEDDFENDGINELMWYMFRAKTKFSEKSLSPGTYVYRYEIDDYAFEHEEYDAKIWNEDGDAIYLYQIK